MSILFRHNYPGEAMQLEIGDAAMAYLERENFSIWPWRRENDLVERIEDDAIALHSDDRRVIV